MPTTYEYRITVFGEPRAPWRRTWAEAMADAIALELASWDGEAREHFLAVPVSMERRAKGNGRDGAAADNGAGD